jgi:hypothetical protein
VWRLVLTHLNKKQQWQTPHTAWDNTTNQVPGKGFLLRQHTESYPILQYPFKFCSQL